MGFENHGRKGLVEVASKIALKYGVVYNAQWREFRGDPDGVQKAVVALERWAQAEQSWVFRTGRDAF